jgi:hypothetical protein
VEAAGAGLQHLLDQVDEQRPDGVVAQKVLEGVVAFGFDAENYGWIR